SSYIYLFFFLPLPPPSSTLFPYTTLFRSLPARSGPDRGRPGARRHQPRGGAGHYSRPGAGGGGARSHRRAHGRRGRSRDRQLARSEEHTSELQSRFDLVCRLLLEKKKKQK